MRTYDVDQDFDVMVDSDNMDVDDVESSRIYLTRLMIDESSSMEPYEYSGVMVATLENFVKSVENSKAADEMLVARTSFSSQVSRSGYQKVQMFPTDYETHGVTRLYDAIVDAQRDLYVGDGSGYIEQHQAAGTRVRGACIILSDGCDVNSQSSKRDAIEAIRILRSHEITVAFIAFGDEAKGIAEELGIPKGDILETDATESALRHALDIASKSAIEASKHDQSSEEGFWDV